MPLPAGCRCGSSPDAEPQSGRSFQAPRGLRVDLLYTFITLADELHFTRAASRLFLSQSGLSRRIGLLESTLGVSLVLRSTRSVELTAAGRALLPHAQAIVAATDAATDAIRQAPHSPAFRTNAG